MLVVPVEVADQFSSHLLESQWNGQAVSAFVLECTDEEFGNSDADALAHSAKSRVDAFSLAPWLESVAPELRALVRDNVLGLGLLADEVRELID